MTTSRTIQRPANTDYIALMITRRCNMTCAHCSVESAPRVDSADPTKEQLLDIMKQAAAAGVKTVQFTGGEPMIRQKLLLQLMHEAHRIGLHSALTTNGFWGKNPRNARALLRQMLRDGLVYVAISYDRYHAEFMGPEPVFNIADAAKDLGFVVNVNVTRTLYDESLEEYARLFGDHPAIRMRLYDVQPVGRARRFEMPNLRAEVEGFCNSANQATFTEDGRMIACNGPAFFDSPESPRHIGGLATESVKTLLERHGQDPIIDTIRTFGPAGLRDELLKDERFAAAFDKRFAGQCDLCHHITGNPEMVAHLRERLSTSSHAARRAAKWQMIRAARSSGELTREYVNGPGTAQVFYTRITTGQMPDNAHLTLGRADIDWDHLARYYGGAGMAGQLAPVAVQSDVARWAPPYFSESLKKRALADAHRELSHRETLQLIHDHLTAMGTRAILLKGAALYLQEQAAGITPMRIPGDIDILLETESAASELRQRLIAAGFQGQPDAPRTAPHHLAPIRWRHSFVEIHTAIMPSFWGLPESAMMTAAPQVPGWTAFHALTPEHMILHETIHTTTHLYSFGMKVALDIFRINRLAHHAGHTIDWQQIIRDANATHCPRAFWTPIAALQQGLPGMLPIPTHVHEAAPRDKQSDRMNRVAFRRMFTTTENADDMNPITRNGFFILLHNNALTRLRYLARIATGPAAESRNTALAGNSNQSRKMLKSHFKSAWQDLKSYRKFLRH